MRYLIKVLKPRPLTFVFFLLSIGCFLTAKFIFPDNLIFSMLFASSGLIFVFHYFWVEKTAPHIRIFLFTTIVFIVRVAIHKGVL
ncbi:hypothetical protein ACUY4Q_005005 (plasmid) [Phytobacter sp. AG2a]